MSLSDSVRVAEFPAIPASPGLFYWLLRAGHASSLFQARGATVALPVPVARTLATSSIDRPLLLDIAPCPRLPHCHYQQFRCGGSQLCALLPPPPFDRRPTQRV